MSSPLRLDAAHFPFWGAQLRRFRWTRRLLAKCPHSNPLESVAESRFVRRNRTQCSCCRARTQERTRDSRARLSARPPFCSTKEPAIDTNAALLQLHWFPLNQKRRRGLVVLADAELRGSAA